MGAAAIPLTLGLLVPTSASAIDAIDTRRLREAVTVNGIRAGYNVRLQEFTFPFFRELDSAVSTDDPAASYATAAFTYSGSGDVSGPIVPTNDIVIPPVGGSTSGCELADFPTAPAEDAIALVQRGTCTFEIKADNALAAGYEAVIIFNEGKDPGRVDLLTGTLGVPKTIPVVGLSFADGAALYAAIQAGAVTGRAFADTETDLELETVNVIADSPRGKNTDQTVVVGAHLDSVQARASTTTAAVRRPSWKSPRRWPSSATPSRASCNGRCGSPSGVPRRTVCWARSTTSTT